MYKKCLENFSLSGSSSHTPFQVFLSARGPKIAQPWQQSVGIKTQYKCVYQIWGLYMILKPWMQINDFDLFLAVK